MIHSTAVIHKTAHVGKETTVWSNAVICEDVIIGESCCIGSNCFIGKGSIVGDGSRLQHGVFLPNRSILESNVFIGPNATFTDDRYPRVGNADYKAEPPILREGCSIGAGATILPGIEIGSSAMVGAGAVVTRNVLAYTTVIGCPAIPITAVRSPSNESMLRLYQEFTNKEAI